MSEADRSLQKAPNIVEAEIYRALALLELGRIEEAREQVSQYRSRSLSNLEVPLSPEFAERFLAGLDALGWQPPLAARQRAS